MDRRIRQIAALITMLLLAVAASSGYVQGVASEPIANRTGSNPDEAAVNRFRIFQECRWERGPILSVDGVELARSTALPEGQRCRFQREYPSGDLAPHVVGQWSLHFGRTGLEDAYNEHLVGEAEAPTSFNDYFRRRPRVGHTLVSTIDTRLQQAALDALAGRRGGVVAIAPKTGAVLVAASIPSYDPNGYASNDRAAAVAAACDLGIGVHADGSPCTNVRTPTQSVALAARRPPGSTFKVVTAAAALESGKYTPSRPSAPSTGAYTAPGDTLAIHNYGGGSCGGNLTRILTASCNTGFARVAVDVGADQLYATASAMGLDQMGDSRSLHYPGCEAGPVSDIGGTRTGCLPTEIRRGTFDHCDLKTPVDPPNCERLARAGFRARSGFGQWVIEVSPFGMAVVAATIANGGFVPRPRFADKVIDSRTGAVIRELRTGVGNAAISARSARELTAMMRNVVTSGTARGAFGGFGVPSAGKTGTAQEQPCSRIDGQIFGFLRPGDQLSTEQVKARLRRCGELPHAWFIAFAPVENPAIAVAVLIERGGGNNEEATGGRVAAPVARKVLESFFSLYPASAGTSP